MLKNVEIKQFTINSNLIVMHYFVKNIFVAFTELDALGDDMLLDEDTSYLDSATIPDPPNTVPQSTTGGQTNVSSVFITHYLLLLFRMAWCWMSLVSLKCLIHEKILSTFLKYLFIVNISNVSFYILRQCSGETKSSIEYYDVLYNNLSFQGEA